MPDILLVRISMHLFQSMVYTVRPVTPRTNTDNRPGGELLVLKELNDQVSEIQQTDPLHPGYTDTVVGTS